jgi:hypothetical protein
MMIKTGQTTTVQNMQQKWHFELEIILATEHEKKNEMKLCSPWQQSF